jgi:hypothetical protein
MNKELIISQIMTITVMVIGWLLGIIVTNPIDIYFLYISLTLFCLGILKTISYIDRLKNK